MYVETITVTRPNTVEQFWNLSASQPAAWDEIFVTAQGNGDIISLTTDVSLDELTFTRIIEYPDQLACDVVTNMFTSQLSLAIHDRNLYELQNLQVRTAVFTTVP
jgi:hypothetical protein